MLWQLHWQYKDGKTVFREQREVNSIEEMTAFVKNGHKHHSPPENVRFVMCSKESKHFIMTQASV